MLAHTKHGDQKLEGFTVLPHPKPMRPLKLGSDDRRQISAGIRRAMGKDLFPPGCSRYTNDHPSEDTASTSQVKSTKTDGIWMFVLEGLKDICKVSPCVGWRMELEGFQYTWVHELNPEVTEDQKPMRYANTKPRTTDDKWDELDKQFWDQFPREKFEDRRRAFAGEEVKSISEKRVYLYNL
ncbi:hypothetical protein BDP27DRAFT_588414 [Rhodocollybia butyracea]|uniref:Uncharacterized protein n=1 Tax=Rhodocollybia butyracea TaxID=206335 RepID=A0A9P5PWF8_9AGAR|nr:hypothetical protein BDP27DRAFT_588414 [Rhodocollybia butyracea]